MRDFLTGLAIILIVVLTTILVAPYFVDWTGQRGFLEARLTSALGQKVTIGGDIDLKILPTPYLVLDQVVVGGDDGPVRLGIHHLDLELTVAPLLHGQFDIVEAKLEEPTIRLNLERDRTLPALPSAPAFQADVRFDRIQVSDGTLAIADPQSGRTFVFDHLDLDADAGSFTGPFKVTGAEGATGQRTKFHLATTAAEKGRARARLVVDETSAHAGLELDGAIDLADAARDTIRQSFDGSVVISGHVLQGTDAPIAWTLSGPLKLDPRQAALDGGELRLGGEDAGLTLKANAKAQLDDHPLLTVDLSAKQLDIDRLAGAPIDSEKPAPPKLPDLATLRQILAAAIPPIPAALDLAVANATYGGEALSNIEAHLGLGDSTRQPLKLSGDGPGGSHVAIDGALGTYASNPTFDGSVDLGAANLPRVVDWLANVAPSLPWSGHDVPFKSVRLGGHVVAGGADIAADALAVTLDRSVLSGTGRFTFGNGAKSALIKVDLQAEALDLDALPSLNVWRGGSNPFDLDLQLDAKAIRVSRLGDGPLDTGHIRIALAKTGRHVAITEFRADDLGGATIQATGHLDPDSGSLAMTLDASRLDAAAALVRQLAPGPLAEALVARAAVLAPAHIEIDATLAPKTDGTLAPARLSVAGHIGTTRVEAAATPDAAHAGATSISGTLTSPDGGPLLSQLGLPALPMNVIGPSRVTLSATGKAGAPLDSTLAATIGATRLDVTGRFDILSTLPLGSGTLRLQSPDLTPLLQTMAVAFPDMTGRLPADVAGAIALSDTETTLSDLKGDVAGIGVRGALRYRRAAKPALTGALDLDRLALSSLLGLALGPPQTAAGTELWSKEPLGVGLIDTPASAFALTAATLDIVPGVTARNGRLDLGVGPNIVTLTHVAADLSGGRVSGGVTLRRDGRQATVEGDIALDRVGLRLGALETSLTGKLDLAGGGASSLGLIASLAGSGDATAADLSIPGGDPTALPNIFQAIESDTLSVDQDAVVRAFTEAAKAPLSAGTRHFGLALAAGVLHLDPKASDVSGAGPVASKIDAAVDLTQARLDLHIGQTLHALPETWTGPPPTIAMSFAGPLDGPSMRTLDVSGFLNAVAARALARETARIEAYEADIRERAVFNARLQSERRREEERKTAEEDARRAAAKAEADRKARLEAAREERLRKEQAAKAARDKAEKIAHDKAETAEREKAEKAARNQAARDQAKRDQAEQDQAGKAARQREAIDPNRSPTAPPPNAGGQPDSSQAPPPTDPSALGRY